MKKWTCKNDTGAEYIGVLEWNKNEDNEDMEEDYIYFETMLTKNKKYLLFGTFCNSGFMQSGFMKIDNCFSLDENLSELLEDLKTYYKDGYKYCSNIVCNKCM